MSLRSRIIRLAYQKPHLRSAVLPIIVHVAKEFPTQKALDDYLEKHPGADPDNHSVKDEGGGKGGAKDDDDKAGGDQTARAQAAAKSLAESAKSMMLDADDLELTAAMLEDASPEALAVIADPERRNEAMADAAEDMRENRDAGIQDLAEDAGEDGRKAGEALVDAENGNEVTPEQSEAILNATAVEADRAVSILATSVSVARRLGRGLFVALFDLLVDEFSKVSGLGNLKDYLDDDFRKKFGIENNEQRRTRIEKEDKAAKDHGLEINDMDTIRGALESGSYRSSIDAAIKKNDYEEALRVAMAHIKQAKKGDAAAIKRFQKLTPEGFVALVMTLRGEEISDEYRSETRDDEDDDSKPNRKSDKADNSDKADKADKADKSDKADKTRNSAISRIKTRHHIQDADIDWIARFNEFAKTRQLPKPQDRLDAFNKFLGLNRAPEVVLRRLENIKDAPLPEFIRILDAIGTSSSDKTAGSKSKSKIKPEIAFAAKVYDISTEFFAKGLTQDEVVTMLLGERKPKKAVKVKKASLEASVVRLAYAKPHLRKLLIPLVVR